MKVIRILKVIIAIGFLAVAYGFIADSSIFGLKPEYFLVIFSILALIILFMDHRMKQKIK